MSAKGFAHSKVVSRETAVYSYRGVRYLFVGAEKRFLEELKCPICLQLVSDPVQTSCGHLFCGECIEGTETCPLDRQAFTSHKDNYNDRRVRNFKVKCPNVGKFALILGRCQWQGDLGDALSCQAMLPCVFLFVT